jgi:hypothetical protein
VPQLQQTIRIKRICQNDHGHCHLEEFLYAGAQCILTYQPMSLDDAIRFEGETLRNLEDSHNQSPIVTEILANCDECAIANCPVVMSHDVR